MRIGLISDIHGNLVALDAVLDELAREGVERIICLGDVGSLGPQPHEVIERLRDLRCAGVLGNTDDWLLTPPVVSEEDTEDRRIPREINVWCAQQMTQVDRAYLEALPPVVELGLGTGLTLLGYHGSPRSYDDVIAAVTPDAVVTEMLAGSSADVMVGGHTHIQMVRRYGDAHMVNVGSVGLAGVTAGGPELPMNRDVRWAEYGVLSVESGRLSIELRRTSLNMAAVLEAGRKSNMPHLEWWLGKWEAESKT